MTALLLALALAAPARAALGWRTDLAAALEESKASGKPVLLEYFGSWCPPCQQLDKEVFRSGALDEVADRLVLAKLDADRLPPEGPHKRYPVASFPTVWVIGPDGKPLGRYEGFEDKAGFMDFLKGALDRRDQGAELARKLAQSPKDPALLSDAYGMALMAGDREKAGEYKKRIEDARDEWQRHWEFSRISEVSVTLNRADPDYKAVLGLADAFLQDLPDHGWAPGAWYAKARALRALGRTNEADRLMAGIAERFPKNSGAYWRLLDYSRRNDVLEEQAGLALERGFERFPKDERFLANAVLFLKDRDKDRALETARRLKAIKPDNAYYDDLVEELQ